MDSPLPADYQCFQLCSRALAGVVPSLRPGWSLLEMTWKDLADRDPPQQSNRTCSLTAGRACAQSPCAHSLYEHGSWRLGVQLYASHLNSFFAGKGGVVENVTLSSPGDSSEALLWFRHSIVRLGFSNQGQSQLHRRYAAMSVEEVMRSETWRTIFQFSCGVLPAGHWRIL